MGPEVVLSGHVQVVVAVVAFWNVVVSPTQLKKKPYTSKFTVRLPTGHPATVVTTVALVAAVGNVKVTDSVPTGKAVPSTETIRAVKLFGTNASSVGSRPRALGRKLDDRACGGLPMRLMPSSLKFAPIKVSDGVSMVGAERPILPSRPPEATCPAHNDIFIGLVGLTLLADLPLASMVAPA